MKRLAYTLIELIVTLAIILIIGVGLMQVFLSAFASQNTVASQNDAITNGRTPIDVLADHLRNAQGVKVSSVYYPAIVAASQSDITYRTEANTTVRYWLSGTSLKRTDASSTKTVISGVSSLAFTYYKAGSYYTSALTTTTNSHAPTSDELKYLSVVDIDCTVTSNSASQSYKTSVRLRNSPQKTSL